MTEQEIERLALERFPVNFDAYWAYDRNASERSAFIEGAKAIRDRFKQQIDKEPSTFFRTNILHHLNNEQMMSLRDWLNTYDQGTPLKHHEPVEVFDIECDVTGCCGIGPITRENYCPNCGCKIERGAVLRKEIQ